MTGIQLRETGTIGNWKADAGPLQTSQDEAVKARFGPSGRSQVVANDGFPISSCIGRGCDGCRFLCAKHKRANALSMAHCGYSSNTSAMPNDETDIC